MDDLKPWRTRFWSALSSERRAALAEVGYRQRFVAGARLMHQDDRGMAVMVLLRGCVKIVAHKPNGYEAVLALRDPGDLIGELGSIDGLPRSANVEAVIASETLTVPVDRFTAFQQRYPDVTAVVMRCVVARLREADWLRTSAVSSTVPRRLADLLLDLGQRYGQAGPDGRRTIDLPLSQDDLAGFLSVSRRTVSRELNRWRSGGLIGTARRSIVLKNIDELRAIAGYH